MELNKKLRTISHYYHLNIAQTYKFVSEVHSSLDKKILESKKTLEKKDAKKHFISLQKKILKVNEMRKKGEKGIIEINFTDEESEIFSALDINDLSKIHSTALLNMSHIYLIALFEAFNKDYFIELFSSKPKVMHSNRELTYNEVIGFSSIKKLNYFLATKELDCIAYLNIDDFAKYLKTKINIDIKNNYKNWKMLRENYYRRNIIVHNNGKISSIYAKKMSLNKKKINEKLINDMDYIKNCYENVHGYITFIEKTIIEQFNLNYFE